LALRQAERKGNQRHQGHSLPGGKAILFSASTAANLDISNIEVMTLGDRRRKTVSQGGTFARYLGSSTGSGFLVFLNKATLFAIRFDPDKLETRGTAVPILDDVAFSRELGAGQLSFSRSGTLVYRRSNGNAGLLTVAWLDDAGKTEPLVTKPGLYSRPSLSPDGRHMAVEVREGSGTDIWVYDLQRDAPTRLTFDGMAQFPVFSSDGRYIVFRNTVRGMSVIRSDGAGAPQPFTQSKLIQYPFSFTADGRRMAFLQQTGGTSYDVWNVPTQSDGAGLRAAGKPEALLETPTAEGSPAFSPDGRWLAYHSDESGTLQVYVQAFPGKGGKRQLSMGGGGCRRGRARRTRCFSRRSTTALWRCRTPWKAIPSCPNHRGCGPRRSLGSAGGSVRTSIQRPTASALWPPCPPPSLREVGRIATTSSSC
jgi:hypothetical protein